MITNTSSTLSEGNTSGTGRLARLTGCVDIVVEATGTCLYALIVMQNIINIITGGTIGENSLTCLTVISTLPALSIYSQVTLSSTSQNTTVIKIKEVPSDTSQTICGIGTSCTGRNTTQTLIIQSIKGIRTNTQTLTQMKIFIGLARDTSVKGSLTL